MPITDPAAATGLPTEINLSHEFLDPATVPDRYAMMCVGACMHPTIPDGARVWCDRTQPIARGDLVCIFLRPEIVAPGGFQVRVKRLLSIPSFVKFPWRDHPESDIRALAIFGMDNGQRQWIVPCAGILGIHKCMGLVPAEMGTYRDDKPELGLVYGQEPRTASVSTKPVKRVKEVGLSTNKKRPLQAKKASSGIALEEPTTAVVARRVKRLEVAHG